jgi:hypothetical protein
LLLLPLGEGRFIHQAEMMPTVTPDSNDFPLPAYTHIPGVTAHPTGDPTPDWSSLPACEPFQYGRCLFNAGYYWEAHEAWEGVWIAAGRVGLVADFVKGLIKLAAAGVKLREGELNGVRRHLGRAEELFLLTRLRLMMRPVDDNHPAVDLSRSEPDGHQEGSDLRRPLELAQGLQHELPAVPEPNSGRPVVLLGQL